MAYNPLPASRKEPGLGEGQQLHLCTRKRTLVTDFSANSSTLPTLTAQEREYHQVLCERGIAVGAGVTRESPSWAWAQQASSWEAGTTGNRTGRPPPAFPRSQQRKQRGRPTALALASAEKPNPLPAVSVRNPRGKSRSGGGNSDQGNDLKVPAKSDLQKRPPSA